LKGEEQTLVPCSFTSEVGSFTCGDTSLRFQWSYPEDICEMAYITNSHQSHKSCRKYKSENGANKDPWINQKWDQVPRRSKYPLSTSHTSCELHFKCNERALVSKLTIPHASPLYHTGNNIFMKYN
jgi:hypothetical protein